MSDTTTPTESKKITIKLSERRPLTVRDDEWPVIASAEYYDSPHHFQANRKAWIKVREHDDGRRIVYGLFDSQFQNERNISGGYLVESGADLGNDAETVRAIRRVAGIIGHDELAAECIGDLPAEEI